MRDPGLGAEREGGYEIHLGDRLAVGMQRGTHPGRSASPSKTGHLGRAAGFVSGAAEDSSRPEPRCMQGTAGTLGWIRLYKALMS